MLSFSYTVFLTHLNPAKAWLALNMNLCCTKPSTFCSSAAAKLFHEEYALVSFQDLCGKDGAPMSCKWFGRKGLRSDKVHVASALGLFLGILRLRTLENCPFIKSYYFESTVSWLNSKTLELALMGSDNLELVSLKSHVLDMENQLSLAYQEILSLREKLESFNKEDVEDLLTLPATTSAPNLCALPPTSNSEENICNQLTPRQEKPK